MNWDKEIEKKIREAMESGAFDNLPGKGQPLSLDQNPHEDPSWRLAHHILKSNNFSLPWVEKRREIEDRIETARKELARAWEARGSRTTGQGSQRSRDWDSAVVAFRQQVGEINRLIRTYNLEVPSPQLHLFSLDADREIDAVKNPEVPPGGISDAPADPLQS
jgi:DnaJ family protein C protein 28